jgi:hypothetical protein
MNVFGPAEAAKESAGYLGNSLMAFRQEKRVLPRKRKKFH